jgi:hypothetical protein
VARLAAVEYPENEPQRVVPMLRQELNQALDTMVSWRIARQHRDRDRPAA